jgi:hypothetical protein
MKSLKNIPHRIVLSRKGFDSSAGGCASPILHGEMISLPIPEHDLDHRKDQRVEGCPENHITYHDLAATEGKRVAELVAQLTKGKVRPSDCVHLDPDIRPELRYLKDMRRPLTFGQSGGSQTELKDLLAGDLFLFFGWFRDAQEYSSGYFRFDPNGADMHAIWGWLQIAEKVDLPSKLPRAQKIASHHPHVSHHANRNPNCLYIAGETLSFLPKFAGAGTFSKFHDGLQLSDKQKILRSYWRLPAFFKKIEMTHLPHLKEWKHKGNSVVGEGARGRGQEFIFETKGHEEDVAKWLEGVFGGKRR